MTRLLDSTTNPPSEISEISLSTLVELIGICMGKGNSNNNYYTTFTQQPSTVTTILTVSKLYCVPITSEIKTAFTKIGTEVLFAGTSSAIRLGLYKDDGPNGFPGSLVLDAGTVDSSSTGILTIDINQTLLGQYWIVAICSANAPTVRVGSINTYLGSTSFGSAVVDTNTPTGLVGLSETSVSSYFTSLPASLAGDTFTIEITAMPNLFLQV